MSDISSAVQNSKLYLRHAWDKRWWLLVIQVIATAAAVVSLQVLPREYRSRTTIRVEGEGVINPLTQGLAVTSSMEDRLASLRQEILSRNSLEEVVAKALGAALVAVIPHREVLDRLVKLILDRPGQYPRLAHGQLVPFAAHHLDQDRQLQLAAAGNLERVRGFGLFDTNRRIGQQLPEKAFAETASGDEASFDSGHR